MKDRLRFKFSTLAITGIGLIALPGYAIHLGLPLLFTTPYVLAQNPGLISVIGEDPIPIAFTIGTGVPYKLAHPTTKIPLWDTPDLPQGWLQRWT